MYVIADVLILSPSWTTYKPQTLLAGKKAIEVSTNFEDKWKINPKDLEQVSYTDQELTLSCLYLLGKNE